MSTTAERFAMLLRSFHAETNCSVCNLQQGTFWDQHCTGEKHFNKVCEVVDLCREAARGELWQKLEIIGGSLKYNHLDGEGQAMRYPQEPEVAALRFEELAQEDTWFLVGQPSCVSLEPASKKDHWPNLWSIKQWKEKMDRPSRKFIRVLEANTT